MPANLRGTYRSYAATSEGLVLTGILEAGKSKGFVDAAVLNLATGRWRELPVTGQREPAMHWTGSRLVGSTMLGGLRQNGNGPFHPWGGVLDPATGAWERLPNEPPRRTGGWHVDAFAGRWMAIEGWIFDDATEAWTKIPTPAGSPDAAGSAVWAGDVLIAFGAGPALREDGTTADATNAAWSYSQK